MNPEGAVFCQDCGSRFSTDAGPAVLVGTPSPSGSSPQGRLDMKPSGALGAATESPRPSSEQRCVTCGAANPPEMAFCTDCGARLAKGHSPEASVSGASRQQLCSRCGEPNPPEFNFCQHCGVRIREQATQGSPPTPPSGLPVPTATPAAAGGRPPRRLTPDRLGAPVMLAPGLPAPEVLGLSTAPGHRGPANQETPAGWPDQAAGTIGRDRVAPTPLPAPTPGPVPAPGPRALARLVSVNRDGSDGVVFPVTGERFDIGRRTGTLLFEDDGYLSERHVRLERRQGSFWLVDLDSLNGVFVRIRQREELFPGAKLLVGMELLRFDLVPDHERDPAPAMEHGVLVFGTPPKLPWARLRQLTTAGITRDTYHLYRAEVVLGRESGDIIFSDDDFMSRMHAAVRNEGGKAWLVDLNSSNGTYLQVRGERILTAGDYLRLGDQLLRFEVP